MGKCRFKFRTPERVCLKPLVINGLRHSHSRVQTLFCPYSHRYTCLRFARKVHGGLHSETLFEGFPVATTLLDQFLSCTELEEGFLVTTNLLSIYISLKKTILELLGDGLEPSRPCEQGILSRLRFTDRHKPEHIAIRTTMAYKTTHCAHLC